MDAALGQDNDAAGPKHLVRKLTRAKLEQLVQDLLFRSLEPCKKAIADAGVSIKDIDEVVLVGGQTRMPKIQEMVKELFGREPHRSETDSRWRPSPFDHGGAGGRAGRRGQGPVAAGCDASDAGH